MSTDYWGCCGFMKPEHRSSCQYYDQLPAPELSPSMVEIAERYANEAAKLTQPHLTDKELLKLLEPRDEGANAKQVGGEHYKNTIQHWDWVASNDLDYFQGQITKYVARWRHKNGLEDLLKAAHFLEKYIELTRTASAKPESAGSGASAAER